MVTLDLVWVMLDRDTFSTAPRVLSYTRQQGQSGKDSCISTSPCSLRDAGPDTTYFTKISNEEFVEKCLGPPPFLLSLLSVTCATTSFHSKEKLSALLLPVPPWNVPEMTGCWLQGSAALLAERLHPWQVRFQWSAGAHIWGYVPLHSFTSNACSLIRKPKGYACVSLSRLTPLSPASLNLFALLLRFCSFHMCYVSLSPASWPGCFVDDNGVEFPVGQIWSPGDPCELCICQVNDNLLYFTVL